MATATVSAPATPIQCLKVAYLLNDIGAAHQAAGNFDAALALYTDSLRMRSDAIDAAVAGASSTGAVGGEVVVRSRVEMESYTAGLVEYLHAADAQLPEDHEAEEAVDDADGAEVRLLGRPLHIMSTESWTTVRSWLSSACVSSGGDASSVTLYNMSLLHIYSPSSPDLSRAAETLTLAYDSLDTGSDTELLRAAILNNLAWVELHSGVAGAEEGTMLKMDEAASCALVLVRESDNDEGGYRTEAADVLLSAAGLCVRAGRAEDALVLCDAVTDSLSSPRRSSSASRPVSSPISSLSPAKLRVQRRAHLRVASALHSLGESLFLSGRLRDATTPLVRSLFVRSHNLGEDHPDTVRTAYLLGRLLHDREEYVDALGMYERALAAQSSLLTSSQEQSPQQEVAVSAIDVLNTMCNIAKVHLVRSSLPLAMEVCSDALRLAKSHLLASGDVSLAEFVIVLLHMRGSISREMGDRRGAHENFCEALRIAELAADGREEGTVRLPPLIDIGGFNGVTLSSPDAAAA